MKNFNMKIQISLIIFIFLSFTAFSQSYNSKAIEITNKHNANYQNVTGTKLQIFPPQGFVKSKSYNGYSHQIAGSSIVITEIAGDVHRNFIGFDKKQLFKTGVIVDKSSFYLINGFDAMLIEGNQSAYGKVYNRIMLVIGDYNITYLISASVLSNSSEKHQKEVKEALLGVIFSQDIKSDVLDRFDFSVDVSGTILKKGNLMLSSMTFTDDGNVPSKTDDKTSFLVRKQTAKKEITGADKKTLAVKLFDLYPLEWTDDMSREPKEITIGNLSGYEIYSMGVNKELYKTELVYQVVLYKGIDYYVITGITYGDFENNLGIFKKVAKTFKPYK
ncbi:MAG: hypothetical protein C0596_17400 [Marinilabiliales bacterium]|nr:MAG: hypothetical protein C0596_17400 [Marinilabiliales bacterium]